MIYALYTYTYTYTCVYIYIYSVSCIHKRMPMYYTNSGFILACPSLQRPEREMVMMVPLDKNLYILGPVDFY